jgi:ankyrin repeat protein
MGPKTSGWTPLYMACEKDHEATARLLLERGAAVDQARDDGWMPLLVASYFGHAEVVRTLLQAGANKELRTNRSTALDVARGQKHEAVCALLEPS